MYLKKNKNNMNNTLKIVFAVVVVVAVLIVAGFVYVNKRDKENSVVYLSTGEVYVGKLSHFPRLVLDDSYLLQVVKDTTDPNKYNFQLNPIKEALWSPKHLYLNRDLVIFYGPLEEGSKIAETLKGK